MLKSGTQKLSLRTSLKEIFTMDFNRASEVFGFEKEEKLVATSFAKKVKSFIIHLESNLYLTNLRLIIVTGKKYTNIVMKDIKKITLSKSNLLETILVISSYKFIDIEYQSDKGPEKVRFYCSTGAIGVSSPPNNSATENFYNKLKKLQEGNS